MIFIGYFKGLKLLWMRRLRKILVRIDFSGGVFSILVLIGFVIKNTVTVFTFSFFFVEIHFILDSVVSRVAHRGPVLCFSGIIWSPLPFQDIFCGRVSTRGWTSRRSRPDEELGPVDCIRNRCASVEKCVPGGNYMAYRNGPGILA